MSAPRLAFVYHRVAPEDLGGAERYYAALTRTLARDQPVTYLAGYQWDGPRTMRRDGVEYVALGPPSRAADTRRGRFVPKLRFAAALIWHLLRHGGRYDVVHACCFPHVAVLAVRAGLLPHRRTRLVVDWHEVLPRETWRRRLGFVGEAGWLVQSLAVRCGDAAVTFSRLHARRLRDEGVRAPVHVLPEFLPEGSEPAWPPAGPRRRLVVFAGRLVAEKRPELVPAVVAALRRRDPDWSGVIFGSGPHQPAVAAAVEAHQVHDAVRLAGFTPWAEVEAAMLEGAALVFPSAREGFGLVVLEAAASGLPAVLVDEPDNAATELVDDGVNGTVVAGADPELMAEAVTALADRPEIHQATRAWYEDASRRFSLEGAAEAHRALHETLLRR